MSTHQEESSKKKSKAKNAKTLDKQGLSKKSTRSEKSTRSGKSTRSAKSEKSGKSGKSGKSAKSGKSGRSTRSEKSSRSSKSSKKLRSKKSVSSEKSKSVKSGSLEKDDGKVKLMHGKGERRVKVADLVAVSSLMKQRQSEGRLANAIDLRDFTPECVNLLADYIEKRTVKTSVSFFTLAEVLKLSKAFVMEELHKKMEEVLTVAAAQSASNLLQAILVADTSSVSRETETSLHYLAAWRFLELARLDDFHKIPANQFLLIFGSCELNVPHELVAVDAALYWLAGQRSLDVLAPALFSLVRSTYLGKVERQMIVERTTVLNFPEQVTRTVRVMLDSRHNNRVCLTPEHIRRHLPRCGVADVSRRPAESTLPLSRPRPGLVRQTEEKSKKSKRGRKSERSGKKSKASKKKASKSGKESRSGKSSKKSSRSSKSGKGGDSSKRTSSRRQDKHKKMSSAISDAKTR